MSYSHICIDGNPSSKKKTALPVKSFVSRKFGGTKKRALLSASRRRLRLRRVTFPATESTVVVVIADPLCLDEQSAAL